MSQSLPDKYSKMNVTKLGLHVDLVYNIFSYGLGLRTLIQLARKFSCRLLLSISPCTFSCNLTPDEMDNNHYNNLILG